MAKTSKPDEVGMWDAEQGYAFAPESYYGNIHDKALYTMGFLSVQPENKAALAFLRSVEDQADEDYRNMRDELREQRGY